MEEREKEQTDYLFYFGEVRCFIFYAQGRGEGIRTDFFLELFSTSVGNEHSSATRVASSGRDESADSDSVLSGLVSFINCNRS